jgi:hypothetical protein
MRKMRNSYTNSYEKVLCMRPFEKPGYPERNNLKLIVKKESMYWIQVAQIKINGGRL